ncbi:protein kinase C and casein kinase substrate in neurons protein 1-like isoform X3 [Panonychus citri]|uniref:protein kinase C and casein kinase substrate in neurons protein 1-like isoform X3 n=1 Tax=Panonychus citri TaxID=50023 RepID=UPI002307B538|nr:protein kinase C and casein kinase substrate in neurons protein 1-like isoform X3 [Panonychus citri]
MNKKRRLLSSYPVRKWIMSQHSDEATLVSSSDSFWEPGNYKRTTKRTEDGFKLCNDLIQLVSERSEIEKNYGKSLRGWAKKWNEQIEKGPEYGTMEAAWKGVNLEAERRCNIHLQIKDKLVEDVVPQIKQWQKDNYHKSMIQLKEKKDFDDAFKKAQKTWAKHFEKVNKAKIDYHTACKNERSAVNQERNASGDTSLSPDQVKKLQDRVAKCKEEVQKTKEKYEQSLKEISDYNAKYIEDMTVVFDKCQEFEHKRLDFFKKMLFAIHDCLNISANPELPLIYEEYRHTIQNADACKDLRLWSNNNGVGMTMNWPIFEEYASDLPTSNKDKKLKGDNSNVVEQNNLTNGSNGITNNQNNQNEINNKNSNNINNDDTEIDSHINTNGKTDSNPFDDEREEWDDYANDALVDNGEPGVPVRALYDYEGAESDELSFKQGDIFEKLEDEDEQGWCKGRKDGRVGLYPANYVKLVC